MVHCRVGHDGRVEWKGEQLDVGSCFRGKTIGLFEDEGWLSVWLGGIPLFRYHRRAAAGGDRLTGRPASAGRHHGA